MLLLLPRYFPFPCYFPFPRPCYFPFPGGLPDRGLALYEAIHTAFEWLPLAAKVGAAATTAAQSHSATAAQLRHARARTHRR